MNCVPSGPQAVIFLDPPYEREREYAACLEPLGEHPPKLVVATDGANYTAVFTPVATITAQANPANASGAFAWVGLAKCQLQLSNYAAATNSFKSVMNST